MEFWWISCGDVRARWNARDVRAPSALRAVAIIPAAAPLPARTSILPWAPTHGVPVAQRLRRRRKAASHSCGDGHVPEAASPAARAPIFPLGINARRPGRAAPRASEEDRVA